VPRVVDPDARRRHLANAVRSVIRRDGLERASVRAVATEAGLSMGSLRHYFGTQTELHCFAMRQVMEDIGSRIEALELFDDPRQQAEQVLSEFLPLDAERRAESEVWLAFTARALVDPALRALRDEAYDVLQAVCRRLVTPLLGPAGNAPADLVLLEAERLYAVLDGLLLHGVIRPASADSDLQRAVLRRHLDSLSPVAQARA